MTRRNNRPVASSEAITVITEAQVHDWKMGRDKERRLEERKKVGEKQTRALIQTKISYQPQIKFLDTLIQVVMKSSKKLYQNILSRKGYLYPS